MGLALRIKSSHKSHHHCDPQPKVQQCDQKANVDSCQHKKKSKFDLFMGVLEKISAVALGAFSAYVSWKLFVPFFFAGVAIGIYSYLRDKNSCQHSHPVSSCAHGFLEQLTGVKLPAPISLAANVAVTICHIDHHGIVFVPIVGISLGAWVGKAASHYGVLMHKKISVHLANRKPLSLKISKPNFSKCFHLPQRVMA